MSRNIFSSEENSRKQTTTAAAPLALRWRTRREEASLQTRLRWSSERSLCVMLTANSRACSEVTSMKSKRTALFRQSTVWKFLEHFPCEFQTHFLLNAPYFNELTLASNEKQKHYHRWIGVAKRALPLLIKKKQKTERKWSFMGKDCLWVAGESPKRNTVKSWGSCLNDKSTHCMGADHLPQPDSSKKHFVPWAKHSWIPIWCAQEQRQRPGFPLTNNFAKDAKQIQQNLPLYRLLMYFNHDIYSYMFRFNGASFSQREMPDLDRVCYIQPREHISSRNMALTAKQSVIKLCHK